MRKGTYSILENRPVARDVYQMRLSGDTAALTAPGQFVNIELDGFYLRRPISVCDWDGSGMTLLYKVLGEGTKALSGYAPGKALDLLVGLGNGFDASEGDRPLLVGGGVGTPPLYGLAKRLAARGATPMVALGFADRPDQILADAFAALGCDVRVALVSENKLVTDILPDTRADRDHYYACGPEAMLRAVHATLPMDGQLSFEARMACGFGACMGCTCQTVAGGKRVCADGPVFRKEEILW